jgi:hypothetical protein
VLLARNLQLRRDDPRKLFFIAFALALAPLHSGIHESNLNTLAIACIGIGVGLLSRRPILSGIAIAIAMCLKPQVAFFFFAYLCLRKQWKAAVSMLIACTIIFGGSLAWMRIHHVQWLGAFLNDVSQWSPRTGGDWSFYAPGAGTFQLINLQVLAFQFTNHVAWANVLSWILFTLLAGISVFLIGRRVSDKNESAGVAITAVLTLLPVYQRFYTAAILLFVIYWAVENWPATRAKAALLCLLPLLFPLATMTQRIRFVARFIQDHDLSSNLLWKGFVMPHVIWIQLILLILLLAHLYRARDSQIDVA